MWSSTALIYLAITKPKKNLKLVNELGLNGKFVISYLGTHGLAHGLENVLETAALLKDTQNYFLFAGPGSAREGLIQKANAMKLTNVLFLPSQPKEKMPDLWSLSDVTLVHLKGTPLFESVIPSKIFEAMGMGIPIILVAPLGEASRIIERTKSGLVVEPENPQALAQAVQKLATDSQLRAELARNSQASAVLFTRKKQADDFILSLEKALADRT